MVEPEVAIAAAAKTYPWTTFAAVAGGLPDQKTSAIR